MVMVEALVRLAQHFAATSDPLSAINDAKFMHEVRPGEDIVCRIVEQPGRSFAGDISAAGRPVLKVHFSL